MENSFNTDNTDSLRTEIETSSRSYIIDAAVSKNKILLVKKIMMELLLLL
jgi:hypothetical protein